MIFHSRTPYQIPNPLCSTAPELGLAHTPVPSRPDPSPSPPPSISKQPSLAPQPVSPSPSSGRLLHPQYILQHLAFDVATGRAVSSTSVPRVLQAPNCPAPVAQRGSSNALQVEASQPASHPSTDAGNPPFALQSILRCSCVCK